MTAPTLEEQAVQRAFDVVKWWENFKAIRSNTDLQDRIAIEIIAAVKDEHRMVVGLEKKVAEQAKRLATAESDRRWAITQQRRAEAAEDELARRKGED